MRAVAVALLSAASAAPASVLGSWIDPDTPPSHRVTYALPARPPPAANSRNKPGKSSARCYVGDTGEPCTYRNSTSNATSAAVNCTETGGGDATCDDGPTPSPTPEPEPRRRYELVMSDEFDTPGRTFSDGTDPRWTAMNKNDYTNDAQHYYSSDNAYTNTEGELVIKTEARDTDIVGFDDVKQERTRVTKHFRSAMLQSWNKFCFTGGVIEAEVVMPGRYDVGGLWPAFWLLGNLARHTYVGSSEHVWPWAATRCTDRARDAQLINGCARAQHFGIHPGVGRGAPEIDIFEVQPGNIKANQGKFLQTPVGQPFMSASYQVAPGRPYNRPGPGWWPGPGQWYEGLEGGNMSALNILFYGAYNHFQDNTRDEQDYWSDAISYNRQLERRHFESRHRYRLEWELPDEDDGTHGYLRWFLDDELVLKINGTGLVTIGFGSEISTEPSYVLINTAVSSQWGFPSTCPNNCPCKKYDCNSNNWQETCGFSGGFCDVLKNHSAEYRINYVRVYQDPNDPKQKVGCSTPERPTKRWIEGHQDLYKEEDDAVPLKPVPKGGGRCSPESVGQTPSSCGGPTRGSCANRKRCVCLADWTGPNCLSRSGYDPVPWEGGEGLGGMDFRPPSHFPPVLVAGLAALAAGLTGAVVVISGRRGGGRYASIPDAPKPSHSFELA